MELPGAGFWMHAAGKVNPEVGNAAATFAGSGTVPGAQSPPAIELVAWQVEVGSKIGPVIPPNAVLQAAMVPTPHRFVMSGPFSLWISVDKKRNCRSFLIGKPIDPPNWFWLSMFGGLPMPSVAVSLLPR